MYRVKITIESLLRPLLVCTFAALVLVPGGAEAKDYALPAAEKARFKKYLPDTYAKLAARQPVHVVALGDSITNLLTLDGDSHDWVQSYPAIFLEKFTEQFLYTGGVRQVKVHNKALKDKRLPITGTEITMHNLAQNGATSYLGALRATTVAFQNNPDLVIINYGINDANFSIPLAQYVKTLNSIIDVVESRESECILLGPTLCITDPDIEHFAVSRPYASAAKDVAAKRGVFFSDLGDVSLFVASLGDRDKPEELLPQVLRQMTSSFFQFTNGEIDYLHANAKAHRRLGSAIYRDLTDPIPPQLQISDATVTIDAVGKLTLQAELQNLTGEPVTCHVAPLPIGRHYVADNTAFACEVGAEETLPLALTYSQKPATTPFLLPSNEPILRIPLLVSTSDRTTTLIAKAEISPIGMKWKSGLQANLADEITISASVINTSEQAFSGNYTATWKDQQSKGSVSIAEGESEEIEISIVPPEATDIHRSRGILEVVFDNGSRFRRELEISRNLGLQEWIPLAQASSYLADNSEHQASDTTLPGIQFRVDADAKALFLSYDIAGLTLGESEGFESLMLEVFIDARPYSSTIAGRARLQPGAVRELRVRFKTPADGPGVVDKLPSGIFGNGYAYEFSNTGVGADLATRPSGNRRVTITIPQKYFYLHEYGKAPTKAIGNGNSQFGITTSVVVHSSDPGSQNLYPDERRFGLVFNRTGKNDAEGLSILELDSPATGRWSARLF